MDSNLVSVIVPVYNAEVFLDQCINSILAQTYKYLELILVDDGSSDSSCEICLKYTEIDKRVVYIRQDNAGPAAARNTGISKSKGEYIQFVDADDYLASDATETLIHAMSSCDLVISGYFRSIKEGEQQKESSVISRHSGKYNKEVFLTIWGDLVEEEMFHYLWNKMYRTELIKGNIRFREDISIGEDMFFNVEYLSSADSVIIIGVPVYYHILYNQQSITKKYHPALFEMRKTTHQRIVRFLKENNAYQGRNYDVSNTLFVRRVVSVLRHCCQSSHLMYKEKKRVIETVLYDENVSNIPNNVGGDYKFKALLFLIKRHQIFLIYLYFFSIDQIKRILNLWIVK